MSRQQPFVLNKILINITKTSTLIARTQPQNQIEFKGKEFKETQRRVEARISCITRRLLIAASFSNAIKANYSLPLRLKWQNINDHLCHTPQVSRRPSCYILGIWEPKEVVNRLTSVMKVEDCLNLRWTIYE